MQQHLPDTLALLARTPAALDSLLRHLPDTWTHAREAPDAWNALDIVGHLIHCEHTDWMPRARTILEHGDARPFDPFDRFGHVRMIEGKTLPQLLDEFALVRAAYLDEVRGWSLTEAQLAAFGQHPALGRVTLSQLLATWAVHDMTHLHQLSRVLAHQYREAVGPWSAYLGVLHCGAHGA